MALAGLRELGLAAGDPKNNLLLYVETEHCLVDAALVVTGLTPGRARLRIVNHGKAAMTLVDLAAGRAVRVSAHKAPRVKVPEAELVEFWLGQPDGDILTVEPVAVPSEPGRRPGAPRRRVACEACGEDVMDHRDVLVEGRVLCRHCAGEGYYQPL
jgi:formylmethanofuran dehydrogenase subunit E